MSRLFATGYATVTLLAGIGLGFTAGNSLTSAPPKAALPKAAPFKIQGRDDLLLRMGSPYKTAVLGEQINVQLKGAVCTLWTKPALWVAACWPKK